MVKGGFKVYGSPYQPMIPGRRMAFNLGDDADAERVWSRIPSDADIVLTHGPAFELLDRIFAGSHVGDKILRRELLERVRPRLELGELGLPPSSVADVAGAAASVRAGTKPSSNKNGSTK